MSGPVRVAFLGSDGIALPLLRWVCSQPDKAHLVAVYTQPDRPVGRGQKIQPNAIKLWAIEHRVPVFQPEKLSEDVRLTYSSLGVDLALVMAYGHILKDAFISTPRLGTVNFHASILPAYRGASPIQTAVAEGEQETGVSLMRIVRRLDAGPVADVERVSISALDTATVIEDRLSQACVPLLSRNWDRLAAGALEFREQDEALATYCRRLSKEDSAIDWNLPARRVASRINGLNPWPGAQFILGDQVIKAGLAEAGVCGGTQAPGRVLAIDQGALEVATAGGSVRLLRLQRPGGRMLPAGEFLRGCALEPGMSLASAPATTLVSRSPFPRA
ncbi:MAG: methionyl-tRNA formyltransferase [Opitutaceae bacterium]|nr:methionyl-tRNA formyltransferase [Opitutaceae bacterium]